MSNRVRSVLVVLLSLGAAGCAETAPEFQASLKSVRAAAAKTGFSAGAATVAIASLDGMPAPLAARFDRVFATEAATREIAVVDPAAARYLVRGYMSAHPSEGGGTDVSFVYDVFDAGDRHRVDRVADVLTLPGSNDDPWALVDDRVAASLAGRSADRLATALAGPAAAGTPPTTLADAAPAPRE